MHALELLMKLLRIWGKQENTKITATTRFTSETQWFPTMVSLGWKTFKIFKIFFSFNSNNILHNFF